MTSSHMHTWAPCGCPGARLAALASSVPIRQGTASCTCATVWRQYTQRRGEASSNLSCKTQPATRTSTCLTACRSTIPVTGRFRVASEVRAYLVSDGWRRSTTTTRTTSSRSFAGSTETRLAQLAACATAAAAAAVVVVVSIVAVVVRKVSPWSCTMRWIHGSMLKAGIRLVSRSWWRWW